MKIYSNNENYKLYHGNMLDMLEVIEPNSIDSIVTDPPYELNFMGKGWDNSGIAFQPSTWKKCYEVLKPGGYLLAFGGSRTFHRIACAIENAGFEIRDTIMWLYGSGFPKSMNISLMLDKKEGLQKNRGKAINTAGKGERKDIKTSNNTELAGVPYNDCKGKLAKQWQGWGTALKPSFEPIIVARKPLDGTVAKNCLKWGVGGINIDECRIETQDDLYRKPCENGSIYSQQEKQYTTGTMNDSYKLGRFPANTILTYDETDFDEVCGGFPNTKSGYISKEYKQDTRFNIAETGKGGNLNYSNCYGDSGSASRFFYCAKASKKDRDEGLDEFELKGAKELLNREENSDGASWNGKYSSGNAYAGAGCPKKNTHPTVKPTELMQYLVRLVSPNGATILDPFNGSGSTGKAVMYENKERNKNYKYIGIELTEEYLPISRARIEYVYNLPIEEDNQMTIFDFIGEENE